MLRVETGINIPHFRRVLKFNRGKRLFDLLRDIEVEESDALSYLLRWDLFGPVQLKEDRRTTSRKHNHRSNGSSKS